MNHNAQHTLVDSSAVTIKGQVTIPAQIRRMLGVTPADRVAFMVDQTGIRIAKAQSVVAQTAGMLKTDHPILTAEEERGLAIEAMAREAS
jgi:AbrB family looped-hinge helix DNA binding protein